MTLWMIVAILLIGFILGYLVSMITRKAESNRLVEDIRFLQRELEQYQEMYFKKNAKPKKN